MSERSASPARVQPRAPKKKIAHASFPPKVNLSVQDRRHKTRLLNENQRRKDQLLGLTTYDVAAHLHRYIVEPSAVMDESRDGCATTTAKRLHQTSADLAPSSATSASASPAVARTQTSSERDANARWHTQYAQHLQHRRSVAELDRAAGQLSVPASSVASPLLRVSRKGEDAREKAGDEEDGGGDETPTFVLPPATYEEWVAAGCPTGSWAALLQDEVYAPAAAEKALLAAKYDPKGQGPT